MCRTVIVCLQLPQYPTVPYTKTGNGLVAYNIKLRRILATIVVVKNKQYYLLWVSACSLRYRAGIAHAPCYTDIYSLSFSTI